MDKKLDKDKGTIAALMIRFKEYRLPRAMRMLGRVNAGETLMDNDIAFLKRVFNDAKLTDHHAILPTGKTPSPTLPPTLRKIYGLVVDRFVGVFLPDQVVEETAVTLDIGGATFVAKGTLVLEAGWKQVGPGDAAKAGDLPGLAGPHLEDAEVCLSPWRGG